MNKQTHLSKLWGLLLPFQRRSAKLLLGLMTIGMLLETLGVGLIVPAVAVMMQSDLGATYPVLQAWLNKIGNPSQEQIVIYGMVFIVLVYLCKAGFLALLAWWQSRFVSQLQENFSRRIFAGYLRQPYAFHLQRNSAQLIQNTIAQVSEITNVIHQSLILTSELLVIFGISALLLKVEFVGTLLIISIVGLISRVLYGFTKKHILHWGEARQYHEGMRIKNLQHGFGGIKEIKLFGRESGFLAKYQEHNIGSARVNSRITTLQALPKIWLELLTIISLVVLILTMIKQGNSTDRLLPILGLFAAAAFRLMPSANRIFTGIQTMRFSLPLIDNLYKELKLLEENKATLLGSPIEFKKSLIIDNVSFKHSNAHDLTLQNIDITIPIGACVGFIGSSGAGKSTLIDIITGLISPDTGSIMIDGIDIKNNIRSWQDHIGYVPQFIFLTDDTLRCNVAFGLASEEIDEDAIWRAIRAAQLEEFVKDLPQGLDTHVGERGVRISGGQRQRIGIARALYHNPSVLVLDEATSSLNTELESLVMDTVRDLKGEKTIIIITHRLSTIENCDLVFSIEKGKIVNKADKTRVHKENAKSTS